MEAVSNKRSRLKADDEDEDDLFNRLPNELILSHIFSRFTFEEGAQLCILSKRWNKLWAQTIPPKLIFAPEDLNPPKSRIIVKDDQQLNREKPRFRTTIKRRICGCNSECIRATFNRAAASFGRCSGFSDRSNYHCTPGQGCYRSYNLETPYEKAKAMYISSSLENWITKVLRDYCMPTLDEVTVRFPFDSTSSKFIDGWIKCSLKKGVTRLELDLYHTDDRLRMISYTFPKRKRLRAMFKQCSSIVNLREVCLKGVHVSPEVIQFMLNKCLSSTYVYGNHISVSFEVLARKVFCLEYVPNLSELSIDPEYCYNETLLEPERAHFRCIVTRLKKLELGLHCIEQCIIQGYSYTFPKKKRLRAMLKQYSGIVNVREVCLKGVHVSPEVIQFMLNKCPIEHLCLWQSYFSELRISGESIRLKRLELNRSSHISSRLERLELKRSKKTPAGRGSGDVWISASSLVSLKYAGPKSLLHLEHVPNLSELSVDPEYCHSETLLEPDRTHFRCIVTRLKKLELTLSSIEKGGGNRPEFPTELLEATSLEELIVTLIVRRISCVLWPILLINSAPYLRKITIKLNQLKRDDYFYWPHREQPNEHHDHRVKISDAANRVGYHQHLRVVELHGYRNRSCYLELAKKLMCISAVLEQFVVAPDELLLHSSRNEAQELAMLLPFGANVKFTILDDRFTN